MESIVIYHKSDFTAPIFAPRGEVYANRNTAYEEYYIAVVDAFIFDTTGKVFMQKRSLTKKVSPGLLHTSVGGHVNPGEPISFTIVHECIEEFGYPPVILPDEISWEVGLQKLQGYLEKFVLMKSLKNWQLEFTHSDKYNTWNSYDMCHDFIGVCGSEPVNLDASAECFVPMTLEEIDLMIEQEPEKITRAFQAHYEIQREILYDFRDVIYRYLGE